MTVPKVLSKSVYSTYEKQLLNEICKSEMPNHLAIIMDGNRRFAEENLEGDINDGHSYGEQKLEELLDWTLTLGIKYVTVFAFSAENFSRDSDEVDFLMDLCERSLYKVADMQKTHENKMRVRVMGDRSHIPDHLNKAIAYAEDKTGNYAEYNFTIALAYGGRQEIVAAVKDIATKVMNGEMNVEDISEESFSQHLYTADLPDPDLLLRTSGEIRISNFLLWQLAYSELYFSDVYWPGFRFIDLLRAIRSYQQRKRRFGV
jgi:tritrans,polycis-undecaprenyl-diphosphate synthase [geranylgeranyl-diphosphate specific]